MCCLWAGWCSSCCHFTFIVAHACTSFLSLLLTSSLCCAFLIRRHATSVVFLNLMCLLWWNNYFFLLVCFDWVCKAICHIESVFGHLQEVLIHLSESNQFDLLVLVLFVPCLFACSRVVCTQASCKIIHIQCNMLEVPSLLTESWEWCYYRLARCICSMMMY
jgi:hypothetical protein